ncbi:hypothetical protein POF51_28910 [Brevibacillus sp. AG]|uniref:hypothetical protein n=1 Tax=Brevibacillus sp. AG TaxID=3020891 RepID=UPI0023313923|nr:hypothetical protein [Brevibacillus sp. AG]MDC0764750.1 hypothetical protein [Brevibacillus sp. AG]
MGDFRIGLIEDDLMMEAMIIERLNRGNGEHTITSEAIDFHDRNLEELIDLIYSERYDALIIDHKLKANNSHITYEGTDIALAVEKIVYFFPVFILTSYPVNAESDNKFSDVNKIYSKDKYVEDLTYEFVDNINLKIINQILHFRNRIDAAEQELLVLKEKENLNDFEKDKVLELDHLLEKSVCGRKATPLSLKSKDEDLQKLIKLAESIINESDTGGTDSGIK